MPFDGSGNFNRTFPPGGWQGDATANIKITSVRHDTHDKDLADGLTNTITKDGQSQPTANIPMNGKRIVNLGTPVADSDAATKAYADIPKPSTTGLIISGADALGRLSFTSPTGTNGLTFTGADLSWLARIATTSPATANRMVLNNNVTGTGTDVAVIDEGGNMSVTGSFYAAGSVTAVSNIVGGGVVGVKSGGNGHFWFYGPGNEDRGVIFTNSGAPSALNIRNGYMANFAFGSTTDGSAFYSPGSVYAGNAYLYVNGDIGGGGVWANWGAQNAFAAIGLQIENRAQAWANDRVMNLSYRKTGQWYDTVPHGICPAGAVMTGWSRVAGTTGQVFGFYMAYLQVYDPVRGWVGFSG